MKYLLTKIEMWFAFFGEKLWEVILFWDLHFILTSSSMIQRQLIIKGPSQPHQGERWHKRNAHGKKDLFLK